MGGRAKYATSVKRTCCASDSSSTVNYGADNDPTSWSSGTVGVGDRRYQRFCPPEESWIDDDTHVVMDGTRGTDTCFFNRTLVSPVLLAGIDDYDELNSEIAANYAGIHNKTTGIPYLDQWDDVWDQEKSNTSFYQLCAAERAKMIHCCTDPTQAFLGGK